MKKILAAALFLFSGLASAATNTPFTPQTQEYLFPATSSSGTPFQILGTISTSFLQYRVAVTCSSATASVSITLQNTQANAATVVAPAAGVPQFTRTYPCGNAIEILSGPPQAWINAIVSSGTATIWIIGGEGL